MDFGELPDAEVRRLEALPPTSKERIFAVLEAAFALRNRDPERGERMALEQLPLAEVCGPHAQAFARLVLVYTAPIGGVLDDILHQLRDGYELFEREGDLQNQVRSGDMLATIYEGTGEYPLALQFAERVVQQARVIGDRLFEGYGASSLAGVLTAAGDLGAAEQRIVEALAIADEVGVAGLEARLRLRLGRVAREKGELGRAMAELARARTIAASCGLAYTVVDALNELGRCAELQGDLAEAEARYDEARGLTDDDARVIIGPKTLIGLARVYLRTDRVSAARDLLVELQALAAGFNLVPVQAEAARALAEALELLGQPSEALAEYKRYLRLRELNMEGETQRAVKRFQARMEIEAAKKDAEIARLKYVELQAMQGQLLEAERMAAVGHLAAGIAHEMNTPLGVVRSHLDTIERALARLRRDLGDALGERVSVAWRAVEGSGSASRSALVRLEGLVLSLRRFTRLDEAHYQQMDLVEGLGATVDVVRATLPPTLGLELALTPVPPIWGWPGALNQAFLTLLMNAVEAVGGKGAVRIETRAAEGAVEVLVCDDGPGIPEDVLPRLFEIELLREGPRARFRVGLATVLATVQRHRGTIAVDTAPGRGTTFVVRLPTSRAEDAPVAGSKAPLASEQARQ